MFTVIIPITKVSELVLNNARILSQSGVVKQIILLNYTDKKLVLDHNIKNTVLEQVHFDVYLAVSAIIDKVVEQENIILLDDNIQIGSKFIPKLVTHYAVGHLYAFKLNEISENDAIKVDKRIGNRITPRFFNTCAVAFQKGRAKRIGYFGAGDLTDFAFNMKAAGVKLKFLPQVLCHKVMSENSSLYINKNTKRGFKEASSRSGTSKMFKSVRLNKEVQKDTEIYRDVDIDVNIPISYSFIIPFMYKGDRFKLFVESLRCLRKFAGPDTEIIIHETDKRPVMPKYIINEFNLTYIFSKWDKLFHRSWALNVPAKQVAKGGTLIFFDADILINQDWWDTLLSCDKSKYFIGWEEIKYLSRRSTLRYMKDYKIRDDDLNFYNNITRKNAFDMGCGGINVMSLQMFLDIKGWPEDYRGLGYGSEDNSMNYKIRALGYDIHHFKSCVHHLYHGSRTPGDMARMNIKKTHKSMDGLKWKAHLDAIEDNWGIGT